jgi:hypothetical protein
MEDLAALMQSVDLISKSVPEGEYLKMCLNMKNLYKVIQKQTLSNAQPRGVAQQQRPVDTEEWRRNRQEFTDLINLQTRRGNIIRDNKRRLKYLKIKQKVTAGIRKDAVRERAQQLELELREYTIEELRAKGDNIPNERIFYRSYLDRQNTITHNLITELNNSVRELTEEIERGRSRWDELYFAVYGRPRLQTGREYF